MALHPRDVIDELIKVLDRRLRRVGVRSHLNEAQVIKGQIRKAVQTGKREAPGRSEVRITVVAQPQLVRQIRSELVEPAACE